MTCQLRPGGLTPLHPGGLTPLHLPSRCYHQAI